MPLEVITASFDILRDEGDELAKRLKTAGVEVTAIQGPGSHCMPHMVHKE